ncbi:3-ketosteroid-9-alpha-hydroxylase subunit A [Gordonia sp. HY285]|uniref:Rieske 2Fe-2S domain-containing protein n=1 Tax=Gordonia liuliyuniae TaxID=2911517 RepID=UPI001F406109|nr:Rieske 2Fe-2S domain-containing protein [Gordonia liuliyuniae]MCF8610425.1 3-ketosteroid-9-alpha-hydroxylase subunit A [Gordonia liuliyuniae]
MTITEPANATEDVREIENGHNPERFARGWHCLGLADSFRDGRPHGIDAFGVKLVVWADSTGTLNILDSYCRHMGADLSQGSVKGDEIACPFHDWRWGGKGRCKAVPYAKRVPPLAKTRAWTSMERNGQLFVWNDPEGGPPEDYIPSIEAYGSDEWTEWNWNSVTITGSHCREIVDNVVDMAHFFYVHLNQPLHFRNIFEDQVATQEMSFKPRADMAGMDYVNFGEESVTQSYASYYGPSYMINRLAAQDGLEVVLINCHYPVRPDSFVLLYGVIVKRAPGMTAEEADALAAQFGQGTMDTFEQDVVIWKNKARIDNPLLCEDDGPVYQLRRWYEQFYVDRADIRDDMIRRFEFDVDVTKANEFWDSEVAKNLELAAAKG